MQRRRNPLSNLITIGVLGLAVYYAYTHDWLNFLKPPAPAPPPPGPAACPDQVVVHYLNGAGTLVAAVLKGRNYGVTAGPSAEYLTAWLQHPGADLGQALELEQIRAIQNVVGAVIKCSRGSGPL